MPMHNDLFHTLDNRFIGCTALFLDADTVLFGAPFDGTTTYRPGSRFGPAHIRAESFGIETYSPYQDCDLDGVNVCDLGELDLPFGNKEKALDEIRHTAALIFKAGKKPFMLGGEHLVSLPVIEEAAALYPGLCVLHFDAHTDLREDYIGEPLSHSTVMRRVWDILGDGHIWQFGIRSGTRDEFIWAKDGHIHMEPFTAHTVGQAVLEIGTRPVYLTVDIDVLDSSVCPGTGTPEAGGMAFDELVRALTRLSTLNIVGADLVELAPHYDQSGASTAVACKLVREMLLIMNRS